MPTITRIHAREVLDSRGRPTIEVEVHAGKHVGVAIAPSGASTGKAEAIELRDGDKSRYDGRGVRKAVAHVNDLLGPAVVGLDPVEQATIDAKLLALDGTPQKAKLGGNAILGVSLAVAHCAAAMQGEPLFKHLHRLYGGANAPTMPTPQTNLISGGLHAGGNLDFQDILVLPVGAPDYPTALEWIVRIYNRLGELLTHSGYEGRLVGDEGGFGPRLKSNREALDFAVRAIEAAKLAPGKDAVLCLDIAATHFFDGECYKLNATGGRRLSSDEMIDQLAELVAAYPIFSIEDGLAEDDWAGWQRLTARLGDKVRLIGDDLLATNAARLQRAIDQKVANAALIKVNQIGTLTETFATMRLAVQHRYACVVSARSGETEDATIADLAVATAAGQIKIGSIVRGERLAKYNRLLRIAEELAARK